MRRRKLFVNFLLLIGGCTTGIIQKNNYNTSLKSTSKSLKFAVADITGLEDLQRNYETFRTTLAAVLGIAIEFFPVENRTAAAAAFQSSQLDIVLAGPSEYVILSSRAKAMPIIAMQRPNYYPLIIVRADSKIQSLNELQGKTIALRKIGSTSGHLAAIKMLLDAGLNPETDIKIVFLADQGLQALKTGEVDAWTVASDRYDTTLESQGLSKKDFSILAKGRLLPSDVFVMNSQLPDSMIQEVRSRMLKHQDQLLKSLLVGTYNQPYKGSKMIPAHDADYNMIREVYQKIGQGSFL